MSVAMHEGAVEVLKTDPEGLGRAAMERVHTAVQVAERSIYAQFGPERPMAQVQQAGTRQENFVPATQGVSESARYAYDQTAQAEQLAAAQAAVSAVDFVPATMPTDVQPQAAAPVTLENTVPFDAMAAVDAYAGRSMN